MRLFVAATLALGAVVVSRPAAAADCMNASSTVQVSKVTRSKASYQVPAYSYFVSQVDCEDGDVFSFPYTAQSAAIGSNALEAWVAPNSSTDCSDPTTRDGTVGATKCTRVYENASPSQFGTITFSSAQIAAAIDGVSGCTYTGSGTAPVATTIYFMLVPGGSAAVDTNNICAWTNTSVDLTGPTPPSNVVAGIGDTLATLTYTIGNNQTDVLGYKYFCDPPPGGVVASGSGGATSAGTTGGAGGTGTTASGGGAGGAGGASSSSSATSATTSTTTTSVTVSGATSGTASGGGPTCPSTALFAGQTPDLKYLCGTTNGVSGNATGLTNGTTYAIGVAAYDNLGNVGPLSNVVCVTPGPIDDFFSVYKESGGQAGGCVLSADEPSRTTGDAAGVFAGVGIFGLLTVRRARRRRSIARKANSDSRDGSRSSGSGSAT